jgi:hypothetical protein
MTIPTELKQEPSESRWPRTLTAVVVGLLGSVLIWVAAPYNDLVLGNPPVANTYLPVAAMGIILAVVLLVNPLLHWLSPRLRLDGSQLAIALGMMLVACVLPWIGLLWILPYNLVQAPLDARVNKRLAEAYEDMGLPPGLFPDKIGFNAETPASDAFVKQLAVGESIPWGAWLGPLWRWGLLLLFAWLLMVGLALIVLPQWRRNERLPFPLLTLQQSLIQTPEADHAFAPLLRQKSFWIAAGAVFLLHLLAGAKIYYPTGVAAIPLSWNLRPIFSQDPFWWLPSYVYRGQIYFMFVGIAFFMPSRTGFSLWFFTIAYALYVMISYVYLPPFHYETVRDHRTGAMIAVALGILWLGRAHWAHVFRCVVRKATSEEDRKDRKASLMFAAGCLGMTAWLAAVGVPVGWAVFYVGFVFMVCLLVTRIVAETGMPFVRIDMGTQLFLARLAPVSWLTPAAIYFSTVVALLFELGSHVSATTMATHALGLDDKAPPRRQFRFALLLVGLLVVGLVVCGAVHLKANYTHSMTLNGVEQPLNSWGLGLLSGAHADLLRLKEGTLGAPIYNQRSHLLFGAILGGLLLWACLRMPKWPFHPIGLVMAGTYAANIAWPSIFLGWLSKELVLRYGGARIYRSARPAFMGLVIGAVLAAVFWGVVPAVLALWGKRYLAVPV